MTSNSHDSEVKQTLDEALVSHVFKYGALGVGSALLIASFILLGYYVYSKDIFNILIDWYVVICLVIISRLALIRAYASRHSTSPNNSLWRRLFIINTVAIGLCWGYIGFMLITTQSSLTSTFTIILLAGISAGAVPFLSGILTAAILLLVTTLGPLICGLLLLTNKISVLLAVSCTFYLIYLIIFSIQTHNGIRNVIELELKNLKLSLKLSKTRHELIALSRQAGMSEVATSILHNIGNILNSVNISIYVIQEVMQKSQLASLVKINHMLQNNLPKQPDYLVSNPKGKLIPLYLTEYTDHSLAERDTINNELNNLIKYIEHIKNVVAMQKNISGISGVKEQVNLPEICDLAIKMTDDAFKDQDIHLIKEYQTSDFIISDANKLLQIIINLIKNGVDALQLKNQGYKKTLSISIHGPDANSFFEISVKDNGVGIAAKDLTKIFSLGFTTKVDGNGFGLHISSVVATELGGSIKADSEGNGKGAVFTLRLPKTYG